MTTTVVTDGTWSVTAGYGPTTVLNVVTCNPYGAWSTPFPAGASWIWGSDEKSTNSSTCLTAPAETLTFTQNFNIGLPQTGTVNIEADNSAEVWVNGHDVGGTPLHSGYSQVTSLDVSSALQAGANTIALVVTNDPYVGDNPAGVVANLTVTSTLSSTAFCKQGGWMNWQTATGSPFTNQGDCVSYVVSQGNDPVNG